MCELPLAYANGSSGGNRIDPETQAVKRQFNPCGLRQIQSLTVGLCIDHQAIQELSAHLVLPNGSTQELDLQGTSIGGNCLISGQLLTTTLTAGSWTALNNIQGDWTVKVRDNITTSSTPMGYLVGWSLQADGLQ